jgi:hypothetical protein
MAKITNIFGTKFRGRIGKDMVATSWKGHEYLRTYVVPHDPKTEDQLAQRGLLGKAVEAWRELSKPQTRFFNALAHGMSGYNLFIRRHIRAAVDGRELELPAVMRWRTEGGQRMKDARLVVAHDGRHVFNDDLGDGVIEIALTRSDAPYSFELRKGHQEEVVKVFENELQVDLLAVLESEALGIKLVPDTPDPKAP